MVGLPLQRPTAALRAHYAVINSTVSTNEQLDPWMHV